MMDDTTASAINQLRRLDEELETILTSFDTSYAWNYGSVKEGLRDLYEKAKRDQWNGTTQLPWDTDVDPERGIIPDVINPLIGYPPYERLTPREKNRLRHAQIALQLSQFLHGEQGALIVASQLVGAVPWIDAKYYAGTQTMDEARHVEVFSRYLRDKLEWQWPVNENLKECRGAAILSSLKRPAILSPFSAMKEDGTDGGVAVEAVGGGSAVGRGEAHAAGGGARAPALGATGAPRSTGRGARGPGGAAARQRRAGAGEQAPRGGAEPAPSLAADEVSRLQRRALHRKARRGAAPDSRLGADGAPRAPCGRRARGAPTAAAEASAPPGSQGPGRAHAPVGREPPRLAGGPRAVAVPHRGDG